MTNGIVVATSTSGLDTWTQPHQIRMLRLHVHLEGKDYLDVQDMQAADFHRWMLSNPGNLASTSPPTQNELLSFFQKIVREGHREVLVLTLSSRLSQTHALVQQMAKVFANKLRIHVFDTETVSHGEAIMALEAERCLQKGMSMTAVVQRLALLRANCTTFLTVGKLDYLVKNGRLSVAGSMLANLAEIRPVLRMVEGEVRPHAKVRKIERALETMADNVVTYAGNSRHELVQLEAGVENTNQGLRTIMQQKYRLSGLPRRPLSAVIAAHVGPDGTGLMVVRRPPALQGMQ